MTRGALDSRARAWLAAILAATAAVYTISLGNHFVYDDFDLIVNNARLADWGFIWKSLVNDARWFNDPSHLPQSVYYRPLQNVWFALNFHLFGLNPIGWHAAMIALQLLTVWLVFRAASMLANDNNTGLLAAAMFALMPIHAEAVVWPSAVAPPLAAAFQLAAFDAYLRSQRDGDPRERLRRMTLSMASFAGALFSYDSAVVFPAVIGFHAFIFGSNRKVQGGDSLASRLSAAVGAIWPYALESCAFLAMRYWVLGFINRANPENLHPLTAAEIALSIPGAIAAYLTLLAMPWRAAPAHRLEIVGRIDSLGFLLPAAGLLALCGGAFFVLRRHPHRRLYLFCGTWFAVAIGPMLNLGALFGGDLIQDRYLYLASFGFCVMVADLAVTFLCQNESLANVVNVVRVGIGALAIVCVAELIRMQHVWHDDFSLNASAVAANPGAWAWHNRLGMSFLGRSDYLGARREFEAAKNLEPNDGRNRYNLGLALSHLGDMSGAAREMAAGLDLMKSPPASAYADLALAVDAAGDSHEAETALARVEKLPGGTDFADVARAQLLVRHGDTTGAVQELSALLARDPINPKALTTLGAILSSEHRYDEALAMYRRAIEIAPRDEQLHYLAALAFYRSGRAANALEECKIALAIAPENPDVLALSAKIEQAMAAP